MPIPSIEELQSRGMTLSQAAIERDRLIEAAPPETRIALYVAALSQVDGFVNEAEHRFESD